MRRTLAPFLCGIAFSTTSLVTLTSFAETRTVGAGKQFPTIDAAALVVNPGDVVEVYDDQTYSAAVDGVFFKRNGDATNKITIRGMRNGAGKRPKLSGGKGWTVIFKAHHYVFEGFEVTGGGETCIIHKANDITIRDTVVHDCPKHGILGTDEESGSITLEYVEVYKCGIERAGDALKHPIYIATDESPSTGFPGSVFRMQHCYVHDANGGNNVKTRAQRNEIYYNWIEGAQYYELELIGPDGAPTDLAREDSDVVGNVFYKKNTNSTLTRLGGDGTGETKGRYRFLNNTFLIGAKTGLLRVDDGIESIEFSNNVVYQIGGAAISPVFRISEAVWVQGSPRISGASNWFPTGSDGIFTQLTGTIQGKDPGFISTSGTIDVRLTNASALIDKGTASSPPAPSAPIPNPLAAAEFVPGQRAVPTVGSPPRRPKVGAPDIGAFEVGSDAPPGNPDPGTSSGTSGDPSNPNGSSGASSSGGQGGDASSGCGCKLARRESGAGIGLGIALGLALLAGARRKR